MNGGRVVADEVSGRSVGTHVGTCAEKHKTLADDLWSSTRVFTVGLTGFEPATPCPPVSREPSLLGATDVACRPESSTEQVEQAGTLITAGGLCISAGQSTAPLPRRRLFQVCLVIANLPTGPDHFGEVLRSREQVESRSHRAPSDPVGLRNLPHSGRYGTEGPQNVRREPSHKFVQLHQTAPTPDDSHHCLDRLSR